jgi:hypothetical protein
MSVVREFERAFNRQDVDGLVDCFAEHGRYRDTFFGEHVGGSALRAMFERMFREGRDYAWTMDAVVESPAMAAAEWTFSYVATEAVRRQDLGVPGALRRGRGPPPARLQAGVAGQNPRPPHRLISPWRPAPPTAKSLAPPAARR